MSSPYRDYAYQQWRKRRSARNIKEELLSQGCTEETADYLIWDMRQNFASYRAQDPVTDEEYQELERGLRREVERQEKSN